MEENYFMLPFYKKWWINFKKKMKEKKENFKFPFISVGIFVLVILILVGIILIVISNKRVFPVREEYDKTGFVEYENLTSNNIVLENSGYKFDLDLSNTHFELLDKTNGNMFSSKVEGNNKADTLTVYYAGSLGTPTKYGNYNYAINYEGLHRYMVRNTDDSVEILYMLGGKVKIDFTDFPALISQTRFENDILAKMQEIVDTAKDNDDPNYRTYRTELSYVKSSYKLNDEHGYYALENGTALSKIYIDALYDVFYNHCGYTTDDLMKDNLENGAEATKKYPSFEISIKYSLCDEGLNVEIINESIKDSSDYPIIYVDVLPYFAAAKLTDNGYSLIPDGSGSILDFNNGREYASNYEQRIYGDELAVNDKVMKQDKTKISFAMYGMNINNKGFVNIIEDGKALCSVVASMNATRNTDGYNQTYFRVYYRETDTYRFESLAGLSDIQTWTNEMNLSNVKFLIKTIEGDSNYNEMAKTYRDYLINQNILKPLPSNKLDLNLTLLGGFLEKKNFVGINYTKISSLTNTKEVKELADKLSSDNINNLNIIYSGFINNGIKSTYNGNVDTAKVIGNVNDINSLNNYLSSKNINFYPELNINTAYTTKKLKNDWIVKDQYGNVVKTYDDDEASYSKDLSSTPYYYLKGKSFDITFNEINKFLNKINCSNISVNDLGNMLYGSYQRKDLSFRSDTLDYLISSLEKNNYNSMIFNNPFDYVLKYSNRILNAPINSTNYAIVKYSVPFYELVLNGYVDYAFNSFNLEDEKSFNYYKLKAIETLSDISMTWTYNKTTDLMDTEYDMYYSTYYMNWYDETIELYKELNNLNIYNSTIVSHEIINSNPDYVYVCYSNGCEILFNYSNTAFTYNTSTCNGLSYLVVKGAN